MPKNFQFKKPFNSQIIINKLREGRKITDGNVSYIGFHFEEWFTVAVSALHMSQGVNQRQFRAAIRAALFSPSLPEQFTEKQLEDECRGKLSSIIRKKKITYTVFFQILNLSEFNYKSLKVGDTRIQFDMMARRKFRKVAISERTELHAELGDQNNIPKLGSHDEVLVDVEGLSAEEAYQIAKESLDNVSGL